MQYKIIYSRRRSVSLLITKEGELIVRAPKFISISKIEELIEQKKNWIIKHVEKRKLHQPVKKQYIEGEKFWYQGIEYPLRFSAEGGSAFGGKIEKFQVKFIDGTFFISSENKLPAKDLVEKWYRKQAKEILFQRAEYWAGIMNLKYRSLKITGAKTRWGSCTSAGNINFSFRLVMAPETVINYVIIHELSHLTHKNHSQSFWNLVSKFYPEYKNARKWLNANGHKLVI